MDGRVDILIPNVTLRDIMCFQTTRKQNVNRNSNLFSSLPMPRAQAQMLSVDDLHDLVAVRFDETQNSLANHKKNSVALYKIHVQAASIIQSGSPIGEEAFEQVFLDMLARTLAVKQGPCPDRVVKFVAGYIKFINEKGWSFWPVILAQWQLKTLLVSADEDQNNASTSKSDDSDDTLAARFTSTLLEWLLDGFRAKSKVVRQRAVTIVGEMIAHLGEIELRLLAAPAYRC